MKKSAILGCFVAILAVAEERPPIEAVNVTDSVRPATLRANTGTYVPGDVKVLGIVDYGKTQYAMDRAARQHYRAFVFSGYGGDRVAITLKGENPGAPFVVTDSALNKIGTGASTVTVALPYRGPDIEVYYIVFPSTHRTAHLTVEVKKVGRDMRAPALRIPPLITEMKSNNSESNRQGF